MIWTSIPGEASEIFDDFVKRYRHFYANEHEVLESILAYAMWCKQQHHLTGPSFQTRELRQKMWEEIIADYSKPTLAGSFFEHRLEEMSKGKKKS
jgi:hypothetical protein